MGRFITSGHRIDSELTPVYTKDAGAGSFFSGLITFYDQTFLYPGNAAVRVSVNFASDKDIWTFKNNDVGASVVTTLPHQWLDHAVGPNGFQVRRIVDHGPQALDEGPEGVGMGFILGKWYQTNTNRQWSLFAPAPGLKVENKSTYEIMFTTDPDVGHAIADVTLIYDRPL